MAEYTYRAFISYSWADAKWGKWLQHVIETYHTPKALIEKHAETREIPARLTPLFKDREEQAAGASIGASIEAALADSEYLIVICSPNSAQSQWVNHEIAWFKENRDPDKILALIVAGEPGDESQECFPKALTHKIAPDLTITDEPDEAPLAADAREGGDGKRLAKMKLVAAMLGVGLDQLLRRDDRRRVIRARMIAGASMALALVMSGLTWFAVEQRNEAEFQRDQAETLIENSLTEMRDQLEPVGRLDLLEGLGSRALEYYAAQKLDALDADALGRRARAMLLVGEVSNIRGDSEEALKAFTEAAATTQEQLARDPDNEQRIFDHAQSVFWVGYIAYNRGELEDAEAQFREYKRLADRLIELNPDKPEWQMESSYAEGNLGTMFHAQGRMEEAEGFFVRALERLRSVVTFSENDAAQQVELGKAINWLALTKTSLGRHPDALELHREEVALYEEVLEQDPRNTLAMNRLSVGLQYLAGTQLVAGEVDKSIASYLGSLKLNDEMRRLEPEHTDWMETAVAAHFRLARVYQMKSNLTAAEGALRDGSDLLSELILLDAENTSWSHELRLQELTIRSSIELAQGKRVQARRSIDDALSLALVFDGEREYDQIAVTRLLAGDILMAQSLEDEAVAIWQRAYEDLPKLPDTDDERFILAKRLRLEGEAKRLQAVLERRGFRHPAFLAEK